MSFLGNARTLAENVLEVELAAKPSGQILVTVEPPPR